MKLVIFDCDGTLVDSQHGIVEAMARAFRGVGLEPLPRERVLSIVGLSLPLAIERLLPKADPDLIADVTNRYRQAFFQLRQDPGHAEPMYDGIYELVHHLSACADTLLGVATGKSVRGVTALFDRYDLHPHFVTIQTADSNPSKPHPAMIQTAIAEAGSDADKTLMIGDTTFDIDMANNAGVRSIGVAWGYHPRGHLERAGANVVVSDSRALHESIDLLMGDA